MGFLNQLSAGESSVSELTLRQPLTVWHPSQVAAHHINSERRCHKQCPEPETPVAMHPRPIRARTGLTFVAAVSFMIVLASRHLFSIFHPVSVSARISV